MDRIFHTWDKWECYPAGFYENNPPSGISKAEAVSAYSELLRDTNRFESALNRVLDEWPNSCEHYLTNEKMNRIAWLGQAAICIEKGIPSVFRGGFSRLDKTEQRKANETALAALNKWLARHGHETQGSIESASSKTKANIY